MSFLTRTQPIRQLTRCRTPFTAHAFSVSALRAKGPIDVAKETLKTMDRKVSDKLVGGIKAGETIAKKTKEVTGIKGHEVKKEFEEDMYDEEGEVRAKADELVGEAKGKASEVAGAAKGKMKEMEGKVKEKL